MKIQWKNNQTNVEDKWGQKQQIHTYWIGEKMKYDLEKLFYLNFQYYEKLIK